MAKKTRIVQDVYILKSEAFCWHGVEKVFTTSQFVDFVSETTIFLKKVYNKIPF
ncbi:hypothetical protein [Virgibacillus sp. DJP39]|uniref:hypothetical protein n=1 Tax=Virgibacillus sp. DJP39 TaxID=3409790 RepID=UPI003BB6F8EB